MHFNLLANIKKVLNFLTETVGGWAHGRISDSQFYWDGDVTDMASTLAKYEKNVAMSKRGAKKALADFKREKTKEALSIVEV